jgi:predicted Zn finger-like uncharacterized protein
MPIQISCPSCQRQLRVPDNLMGQMVKCPSCQNTFVASVEESAPPPRREENVREDAPAPREKRREPLEERYEEEAEPRRRRRRDGDEFDDRPSRRGDFIPHRGSTILTLGIISLVLIPFCSLLAAGLGIPAWIMGNNDMAQIRAGVMDPAGESNTNVGRILGMVSTILFLLGLLLGCCYVVFVVGVAGAGAGGAR